MSTDESPDEKVEDKSLRERIEPYTQYILYGIIALLGIVISIPFLPHIQWLLYTVIFAHPAITQWAIVAVAIVAIAFRMETDYTEILIGFAVVVFVVGLFVGPFVGGIYAREDMSNQVKSGVEEIDTLPETSESQVRVLPRSVADNYAESSIQEPQLKLSQSDLTYRDGYRWSYSIVPDNIAVTIFGNQRGAMFVDLTGAEKSINTTETVFTHGRGQLFTDSYVYQNVLKDPLKRHNWQTSFNADPVGEDPYIAHSTTKHNLKFRLLPIPQVYSVPEHGSVQVTRPDGDITSLSPSEAASSELLEGQNYYPYDLAMFKVKSTKFSNGVLNRYFSKRGVIEVSNLPESGNNWPISVPTGTTDTPELTYFVGAGPAGSGSGLFEVWTIDSQTGEMQKRSYDDSQIGPQKAVDFAERQPEVNRLSSASAVAPVPITNDGQLYWHVKVTPQSESGVLYTAFINADSGDVTLVEETEGVYQFMSEGEVSNISEQSNQTDSSDGSTVTVVITDSEGEITGTRDIPVPEGGSIEVDIPEP